MKKNQYPKPAPVNDLKELVELGASLHGDRVLYTYKEDGVLKDFTHSDMLDSVNALGTAFSSLGLMGKRIAVVGEMHPYYMVTYYAAANGGGSVIPLDKELDNEALSDFINLSEASALVFTRSFNGRVSEIASKCPGLEFLFPISPESGLTDGDNFTSVSELIEKGKDEISGGNDTFTSFHPDPETMAAMIFTSGTTGTSKGVMLSHKNLAACTNACCDAVPFNYDSTFVSVLPMNHSYEVTTEHLALYLLGCHAYINDSLKNALRNFKNFAPNSLILVPLFVETIHRRIWKEIEKKGLTKKVRLAMKLGNALDKIGINVKDKLFKDVKEGLGGNLTQIVCGGAPLSKELVTDFKAFGIDIYEGYGITECSPLVAVNRAGSVRPGSVGPAVLGCDVMIERSGDGNEGEILVKGDNVMMGYYNNPEATNEVFNEDGYFRTGDIGYLDKDGYIHITGRKKNIIILSNGKNIFPEELEEHLYKNECISECVVIGRKIDKETFITAVVYPNYEFLKDKSDEEVEEIIHAAIRSTNEKLPSFKHIGKFEIRKTEFEKTTTKKIKRFLVQ